MFKLQHRFKDEGSNFFSPQECLYLGDPDGIAQDLGGENDKLIQRIKTSAVCYFVVFKPLHYTYLKLAKDKEQISGYRVDYKDSLPSKSVSCELWGKQILVNVGLEALAAEVTPSNGSYQEDCYSCGLWVIKWTN